MKKPNILIMFSDQQRPDTLGVYGQRLPVSPHLDDWSRHGTMFTNAFTPQPVCGPARACLQTGLYATETGCYRNDIALPRETRTIAHHLSDSGYRVGYVGKWHLASTGPEQDYRTKPVPRELRGGWNDYWVAADVLEFTSHGCGGHFFDENGNRIEFDGFRTDATTDQALRFLVPPDENADRRPWCLFISWIEPHHQNDRNHFEGPDGSKERFGGFTPPGDLVGFDDGDWSREYPDYLGCCNAIDKNVGRLFEALVRNGEWNDTLKIYISDHGCHFRTRNGEYKRSCHDASLRIPMIVEGPGFPPGTRCDDLVTLLDIPPTVLRTAGGDPDFMRGRPLQDLFSGETKWRDNLFFQISESQIGRGIRTQRYKFSVSVPIEHPEDPRDSSPAYLEECLYDLVEDPFELNNLLGDEAHDPVRGKLRSELLDRIECVEGYRPEIFPNPSYLSPAV